jgi:hypothetical protein
MQALMRLRMPTATATERSNDAWVRIALSKRNMQILAFHVGRRALEDAQQFKLKRTPDTRWENIPHVGWTNGWP